MCPATDVTTSAGVYHLPMSNTGPLTLDCPSGHNGTALVECGEDFSWSEVFEDCSRRCAREVIRSDLGLS